MITILLPAYNEEDSLPALLPKIDALMKQQNWSYRVVVSNDGSSDRTAEVLARFASTYPIEVIRHKINRGLGETARDLFERAAELSGVDDTIVRMDCDDTHDPKYIPDLLAKLKEGNDVVIASRFAPGGAQVGVGVYRGFISRCANIFMKCFFPIRGVWEYSCGFRAYRAVVIQKAVKFYGNDFIQLKGLGFTCTLEKLIKLKMLGAKFAEIPFVLRYDRKLSYSKMVTSITTVGYLVMALFYHWPWGGWRTSYGKKIRNSEFRIRES